MLTITVGVARSGQRYFLGDIRAGYFQFLDALVPSSADIPSRVDTTTEHLMQAREVRGRYGHGAISVGTQGTANTWRLRQERLSRRFTTCWEEILEVKV